MHFFSLFLSTFIMQYTTELIKTVPKQKKLLKNNIIILKNY